MFLLLLFWYSISTDKQTMHFMCRFGHQKYTLALWTHMKPFKGGMDLVALAVNRNHILPLSSISHSFFALLVVFFVCILFRQFTFVSVAFVWRLIYAIFRSIEWVFWRVKRILPRIWLMKSEQRLNVLRFLILSLYCIWCDNNAHTNSIQTLYPP